MDLRWLEFGRCVVRKVVRGRAINGLHRKGEGRYIHVVDNGEG